MNMDCIKSLAFAGFCAIILQSQKITHLFIRDGAKAWQQAGFKDLHICGSKKPNGGKKHERYFNEATFRSRCSLWTSDKKMEP